MKNSTEDIKNINDLSERLKISDNVLSLDQRKFLIEEGYLIIPPPKFIKENLNLLNEITNELIKKEGTNGGWEGKEKNDRYGKGLPFEPGADRLGNLIEKDPIFRNLLLIPEVIAAAKEVIKFEIKLSGFNLRNPLKNHGHQSYHIDWTPRKKENEPYHGVNCSIFLDESTIENGATRIIPKSHKKLGWPDDYIDPAVVQKNEIRAVVPAGSIMAFNLNTWHAGAKNLNGKSRKAIFIQFKRRDEPQLLNYKKYLKKETINELSEPLKYLLAVRECDPTQEEMTAGPGAEYRKKFGKDRGGVTPRN
tara:strand:- start:805 stop:1722 length:918 start_codon:yes stop_codon:yes gene_type:complete